ncbi:MMPL family transporter [Arenicella sp.]|nr:MMPL family transporter [Arenicella sp.]
MVKAFISVYNTIIFKYSKLVLVLFVLLLAVLSQYASNFRLDASSDSLVLENDASLKYFRDVVAKYNTSDVLVLTYSPLADADLFSDEVLHDISKLREELLTLDDAKSIISILDVPLVQSPPVTLAELNGSPQHLLDDKTDRDMAREELRSSEIYRDLLVSDDFSTTGIIVSLKSDPELNALYKQRTQLREQRDAGGLSEQQAQELERVTLEYQSRAQTAQQVQSELIQSVRDISAQYEDKATIFLGGLPMIVVDSARFIQSDVLVFGSAAILVIILILVVAFRQFGWVAMPLITCGVTGFIVVCLLGLLNWPISVVSSNFLSLLLIITLSLNIHLIVRFRELRKEQAQSSQLSLLTEAVRSKFIPCVYTALTTMVAFASLIVSGIRPVIDFGWIMCLGIAVALLTTFSIFPALSTMINAKRVSKNRDALSKLILAGAQSATKKTSMVTIGFLLVTAIAVFGLLNLTVENRFIDYFKPNTEIYQGMLEIDQKLGGTTPLDIIIDAPNSFFLQQEEMKARHAESLATQTDIEDDDLEYFNDDDSADDLAGFEDSVSDGAVSHDNMTVSSYWFNEQGLSKIKEIQASLEAFPETGKVLSLASSMSVFENLKDAKPMDNFDLAFMYSVLSQENKDTLFAPYMSEDGNQLHISIRVFESQKGLDRNKLITDIRSMLVSDYGFEDSQVNISGMLVLYNNMLNSLFSSQIMTLGAVFLVIFLMFIVLFRSAKLAIITIIPNLFSAAVVLGVMGIFTIPLDLMTITIAAISVGIAVDNSIHFVHRFKEEYAANNDYSTSIRTTIDNVGQAMFYTTLVVTAGFLIMVFSNFVPTMYFGILTALAMVAALIANLIMLPMLIAKFKPV